MYEHKTKRQSKDENWHKETLKWLPWWFYCRNGGNNAKSLTAHHCLCFLLRSGCWAWVKMHSTLTSIWVFCQLCIRTLSDTSQHIPFVSILHAVCTSAVIIKVMLISPMLKSYTPQCQISCMWTEIGNKTQVCLCFFFVFPCSRRADNLRTFTTWVTT